MSKIPFLLKPPSANEIIINDDPLKTSNLYQD